MKFLSMFFKKQEPLKIGDRFFLNSGDPWDRIKTEIVDIKNGWVRYSYLDADNNKFGHPTSSKEAAFRLLYKKEQA